MSTFPQSPLWDLAFQEWSSRLWILQGDLSLVKSNAWFSIHSNQNLTVSSPSISIAIPHDIKVEEGKKEELKNRKIRLYPTQEQEIVLKKWLGASRWVYNTALNLVKGGVPRKKKELRPRCVRSDALQDESLKWILETPSFIRDESMKDLLNAYKSSFASKDKHKGESGGNFEIKHRSRKDLSQSIAIDSRAIRNDQYSCWFYPKALPGKIQTSEPFPEIKHGCRLQWLPRLSHFYLCIPLDLEAKNESERFAEQKVIALDPGVRTFLTGYDPHGFVCKWGHQDIGRIYRLCYTLDKLQSRWMNKSGGKVSHWKRYRMRRAGARIRQKVKNLVDDAQRKIILFLVKNYNVILLPKFETQGMIRRGQRRIRNKTVRAMVTWAHYRFQQRLLSKTREYPWCKVIIVDEAYTSKTCGRCGCLHENLGGNEVFKCPQCEIKVDRDINGARNILLKYLASTQ